MPNKLLYPIFLFILSFFGVFADVNAQCTAHFKTYNDCLYDTINFYDSSFTNVGTIINWDWDFGDGNSSSLENPRHLFSIDGTFDVKLKIVTDQGCIDSIILQSTVHPIPITDFTFSYNCPNDSIQFTNTSSINTTDFIPYYIWSFGDGTSLNQNENTNHIFFQGGNYNITLITSSNNGCVKDTSIILNLNSVYADTTNLTIAMADSALIYGSYETEPNHYFDSLQDINGCDSILTTTLILDSTMFVSINNIDNGLNHVSIYPNPSKGLFYIEKPLELNQEINIKLLDVNLRVMQVNEIPSETQKMEIDLRSYSKGIYYVQLIANDQTIIKKLIKN